MADWIHGSEVNSPAELIKYDLRCESILPFNLSTFTCKYQREKFFIVTKNTTLKKTRILILPRVTFKQTQEQQEKSKLDRTASKKHQPPKKKDESSPTRWQWASAPADPCSLLDEYFGRRGKTELGGRIEGKLCHGYLDNHKLTGWLGNNWRGCVRV